MQDGVQVRHPVIAGVIAFVVSYGFLRFWSTQGNTIPQISWFTVAVIALMGGLVAAGGWQIRSYRRHTARRMPAPQVARRTLVAAQASALVGGVLAGWYAGHAAAALHNLDSDRLRGIAIVAAASALASVGLAIIGFVVQQWCRIDEDDDDKKPKGDATAA